MKWVRWLYERLNWQVNLSDSGYLLQGNTGSEVTGQKLTELLGKVHEYPQFLQSEWARRNDTLVAAAASVGYITSITHDGYLSRQWRITSMGLRYLEGDK